MDNGRRNFLRRASILGAAGAASAAGARVTRAQQHEGHTAPQPQAPPRAGNRPATAEGGVVPVEVPDVPRRPWTMDNGVKVFHLVPEVVKWELIPGKEIFGWGFNGSVPGPTIESNEGDRVRIHVTNKLPEGTSMHWHGLEVPPAMD